MIVYPLAAVCWIGMILLHAAWGHFASDSTVLRPAADFLAWMLMAGAMMLPTTLPAVDDVTRRSYRRRRLIAAVEYVAGYMACWGTAGALFVLLRLHPLAHDRGAATLACLLAALWALLPERRIWFAQCHRQIPLCPAGWRADWDAFRQGTTQGVPCVKMCWLLMLACGISEHDWVMMIGGTILAVREKRTFRLNRSPILVGSLALAVWLLVRVTFEAAPQFPSHSHHH